MAFLSLGLTQSRSTKPNVWGCGCLTCVIKGSENLLSSPIYECTTKHAQYEAQGREQRESSRIDVP